MPTYTVRTGDVTARIKTPYLASAAWLAGYFMESRRPERPGLLIQITGGQYRAADGKDMYIATESVLQHIGRLPGLEEPPP